MSRRLLLAGSVGPERVPARPGGDEPRWFEPLHVRDEAGARDRVASQVAAGADVVVAPTWLTHRRALLPLGETRSARAWTMAAIDVARDGLELGLERREAVFQHSQAASQPLPAAGNVDEETQPTADRFLAIPRPVPLVAAVLPALDEEPEPDSGRLLPRQAATQRDYIDQAGLLADAEPDLILVAGQATEGELRLALEAARATGLPTWASADAIGSTPGPDGLARWLETCQELHVEAALLPPPPDRAAAAGGRSTLRWGGLVRPHDERVAAWLESGATLLAILDGATAAAIEGCRAGIDEHERHELERDARAQARWLGHVSRAASMAPGGVALWLGAAPDGPPPAGFTWSFAGPGDAARLPEQHFRLVVDQVGDAADLRQLGRCLERGGILATTVEGSIAGLEGLRLLSMDDDAEPALAILRREG